MLVIVGLVQGPQGFQQNDKVLLAHLGIQNSVTKVFNKVQHTQSKTLGAMCAASKSRNLRHKVGRLGPLIDSTTAGKTKNN